MRHALHSISIVSLCVLFSSRILSVRRSKQREISTYARSRTLTSNSPHAFVLRAPACKPNPLSRQKTARSST